MGENDSERAPRAERIANDAEATLQATWDLMAHMRHLTLLQTEHGPLLPSTDIRTRVQETSYHYWTETKEDPVRGGQHPRVEILMPSHWRDPVSTALRKDVQELVILHAQKKQFSKGKKEETKKTPSQTVISDDGLLVDTP